MGNYAVLPADNVDLENSYVASDVVDVSTVNGVYVCQSASLEYMIHQFKDHYPTSIPCRLTWIGRSDLAPSDSSVLLQVYNQDTGLWETVATENTVGANVDFTLTGLLPDLTNYKDGSNMISSRVLQLAI